MLLDNAVCASAATHCIVVYNQHFFIGAEDAAHISWRVDVRTEL